MKILNKHHFVELYRRGTFGNAGPTWDTIDTFLNRSVEEASLGTNSDKLYHVRNRIPGGLTFYNCTWHTVFGLSRSFENKSGYYVSEMAPTDKTILQGEACRTAKGLELRYSTVRKPMRDALLQQETTVHGLKAKLILQGSLNAASYDWLMELLDTYDDHIVEFSTYAVCWGTLPGYNTVFWEIRPDRSYGSNYSQFTEVY